MSSEVETSDFWLFGYGSLIWKPPPHYDERLPGYIEGYIRRFWQASEDHRGTPTAPGRVVTLIDRAHYSTLQDHHPSPPHEKVWGAAYHIPSAHARHVLDYLDIREQGGYSVQYTTFHVSGTTKRSFKVLVYIGLPENPQFVGPQEPKELARLILKSRGPSGENREYLFMLEEGLRGLDPRSDLDNIDEHVGDLVRLCKEIEAEEGEVSVAEGEDVAEEPVRVMSTEEQEEIEK